MSLSVRFRPGGSWYFKTAPSIILAAYFCSIASVCAQVEQAILTNAADVLSLSAEQARKRIPIRVKGVVTAAEPTWMGRFFVQDTTGGVFVENISSNQPAPGDVVEVSGVSQPGAYAPIINRPTWIKLGTAPLPEARAVPIEQLMSGAEDGQRVQVSGIVRSVTIADASANLDRGLLCLDMVSGGYRLQAYSEVPRNFDPQTFVGSRVQVKGTAAASFNATLRRFITTKIFVPLPTDFVVEKSELTNPFDEPTMPLSSIAQYRRDTVPGKRVHVKGTVTFQRPGEDFFLEDSTGGLHVRSRQLNSLALGEVVEAVGFPDYDHFLPVLEDAVFRKNSDPKAPLSAKAVTVEQIRAGLFHAELIKISARLLDRNIRRNPIRGKGASPTSTVLTLQSDDLMFTAEADLPSISSDLAAIPIGSTIEVSGVCFTESGADKKLKSLQILLPDSNSVRLLTKPSWWTPQRLLIGLAVLMIVLLVAVSWTVMVSKRNLVLRELVREKEKAQIQLQQAHDQLEERVKDRTKELKFQITARKESELQFKAVLNERTRLAQELHDTLEQTLTGIALQLDTTSKLFPVKPEDANHHLGLARNLVSQSQVEVRRSVWDLRSRASEEFDLQSALLKSGKQLAEGANIRFEVVSKGRVRPLTETVEENLLRIAQEALTNVIKHSQATLVEIEVDYGPHNVVLQIRDNGQGFRQETCVGPREGHFGLLGISERTKRLGGEVKVLTGQGNGTTVWVQVPVDQMHRAEDHVDSQISA